MGLFRNREHETVVDDGIPARRAPRKGELIGPGAQTAELGRELLCVRINPRAYPEMASLRIRHKSNIQIQAGNALYQLGGELRIPVDERGLLIGRGRQADIQVLDGKVSRVHARLAYNPDIGLFTIRDLGSSNGTIIRGRMGYMDLNGTEGKQRLYNDSTVRLGREGPSLGIKYNL
ncbi:FHA domain-containing protein [archaeon]|jgi:hypothetical protein|nr:FHA domain-containing protein [archaeon]MBT4416596.1 FHA domain-containing protein [archaeon]